MSEHIKHECGIVQIRLFKPLSFYKEKYGTDRYGLDKLYLLMEKQHNRGQEGAGVACIKLDSEPGSEYIFRARAMGSRAIADVFSEINSEMSAARGSGNLPYEGEIYIGHLRYSTTGRSGISYTHPFLRRNNWKSRNLCLAGNFNLTNVDEIMADIVRCGQHPRHNADTFIILEQLGYLLDQQVQGLYDRFSADGAEGDRMNQLIEDNLDIRDVLSRASAAWDGGYVITGSTGSGDAFIFRDPWGIRNAFYYCDDELFVAASERAVIQTVMNVSQDSVKELMPGMGIIIKRDGEVNHIKVLEPNKITPCSFERIYFSRGTDADIYRERKLLGRNLVEPILEAVGHDTDNTVFSFIPNTAETAYYGMMEGLNEYLDSHKAALICGDSKITPDRVKSILAHRIRSEKLAVKDIKLRTFIAEGSNRDDLATHVYDVTYGIVKPQKDTIVVIDDSIVRGTTLKKSIIKILSRLLPREIVIVSSSPQVRFPDCYGIDMSRMEEFIAFNAAVELLIGAGKRTVIDDIYGKCKEQQGNPKEDITNYVKEIYAPFNDADISEKIAELVTPEQCGCRVKLIYQTVVGLRQSCPHNFGDWYFTGDYPTPGGNRVVNESFVRWYENIYSRNLD